MSDPTVRGRRDGRELHMQSRRTGAGYSTPRGSMPVGVLIGANKTVTRPWRLLVDTDRALTWEGDVAVRPLEPEGDVGAAGDIAEGDDEGDVREQ